MENEKEEIVIDVNIKKYSDIFDPMDYGRLTRHNLSEPFEQYVYNTVIWYDLKTKMKMIIHIDEDIEESVKYSIQSSIREHFLERMRDVQRKNSLEIKIWLRNACIGLVFLMVNLFVIKLIQEINGYSFLAEVFSIIGSVALWEPVSYILYGWQEGQKNYRYFKKMADIPITFEPKTKEDYMLDLFMENELGED